jgi:hypothetical protein
LYIYVERAGGLSYKGAEFDLTWSPDGDPDAGCYAHVGTNFKSSPGGVCTYLNRGTTLPIVTVDKPGALHVAWANTMDLTSCSAGAVVQIQFEFDGCEDARGCFSLNTLTLLDANNVVDAAWVAGSTVTVRGGSQFCESAANHAPVIDPISDQFTEPRHLLTIVPSATDADGDQLAWDLEGLPAGAALNTETGVITWTPSTDDRGSYATALIASDGRGGADSVFFSVTVTNRVPVVDFLPDQVVARGDSLTVTPVASDADGDALTWSGTGLPPGSTFDITSGRIGWRPRIGQDGAWPITLAADDSHGGIDSTSFRIYVTTNMNHSPMFTRTPDQTVQELHTLAFSVEASDPDSDVLTYGAAPLPPGAVFAGQIFSWTPANGQAGAYYVTFTATDPYGATGSEELRILVSPYSNQGPELDAIPPQYVTEGDPLTFTVHATDPDNDALTYAPGPLPPGATFAEQTFAWTPAIGQAGNYFVTFAAMDPFGASDTTSAQISVAARSGGNENARAWLSWSDTSIQQDLPLPGGVVNLYVRLEGSGAFKGAEVDLTWHPEGNETCANMARAIYQSGTDCTFLNRGTIVPLVLANEPGHYHVAWSNTLPDRDCVAGGNAILLQFELNSCPELFRGCFTIDTLLVLDAANVVTTPVLAGPNATIQNGSDMCGSVVYVDATSSCATCDGTTWATAVHTIGAGLSLARTDRRTHVVAAEGTYRESGLHLRYGTELLGGHPAGGGWRRDIAAYPTVIAAPTLAPGGDALLDMAEEGATVDGVRLTGVRQGQPAVRMRAANDTLRQVTIAGNTFANAPAVAILSGAVGAAVDRCVIAANVSTAGTGVVSVARGASVAIDDCDIVGDSTHAATGTSGVSVGGIATVRNTIVWGLRPSALPPFAVATGGGLSVTYCDVMGGWPGAGNISASPQFCAAFSGLLTLAEASPCVGAGHDGTTIGAFEVGCPAAIALAGGHRDDDDASGGDGATHADTRRPARTALHGVTPSVTHGVVTVHFALASESRVRVEVFDARGGRVRTIVDGMQSAGEYEAPWNGADALGRKVSRGTYWVRFAAGSIAEAQRVVIW